MDVESSKLSIGAVAAQAGVHVETIRFYQRRGLLTEPTRLYGQIRRYGPCEDARAKLRDLGASSPH